MPVNLVQDNPAVKYQRIHGYINGTYTAATDDDSDYHGAALLNGVLTINPGFKPERVMFQNVTARTSVEWFKGMLFGDTLTTAVDGVKALNTANIVEVSVGGIVTFVLSGQVTDNETVVWVIEG